MLLFALFRGILTKLISSQITFGHAFPCLLFSPCETSNIWPEPVFAKHPTLLFVADCHTSVNILS